MRKRLIIVMLMFITLAAQATDYFISDAGSDSNNGLSEFSPKKSLTAVNSLPLQPGDRVLFRRGDTFYGKLPTNYSGSSGNPIVYGAYGTGANPVITGFTAVTAWTNLGSNIWESTSVVSTLSTCNMVAINGVNTPMGRYPNLDSNNNAGYLIRQSYTTTSVTNSSLTGSPDWTGAEIVSRTHNTRLDRVIVTSQSGSTLNFSPAITNFATGAWGFFIQDDPKTLDVQNEWYYNPTTKKILIYSTSQPTNVKVSSVQHLIDNSGNKNYLTFQNITFEGSNECGYRRIVASSADPTYRVKFDGCSFLFIGSYPIWSNEAEHLDIDNCSFMDCGGIGILLNGVNYTVIKNCTFERIGINIGADLDGGAYNAISTLGNNILIEGNSVVNMGHNGIGFGGDSIAIKNNYVDTFNQIMEDGGGISGYSGSATKTMITGNVVLNGVGAPKGTPNYLTGVALSCGIYLDDDSYNCEISNNTVANCVWNGIYIRTADEVTITGNTVFNCLTAFYSQDYANTVRQNYVTNNKFIAKTAEQICVYWRNNVGTSIQAIGSSNNNVIARPIDDTQTISVSTTSSGQVFYDLEGWKAFSSQDANSTKSPKAVSTTADVEFRYNETSSPKQVSFSWAGIDMNGTQYSSNPTLQPYTSLVLIKNIPNPTGTKKPWGSGGKMYKTRTGLPIGGE